MAIWDSADLLSRLRALTNRPSTDESLTDAQAYSLLEAAQVAWTNVIATQTPWVLMGAPTTLTSTDGGVTFPFVDASGNAVFPLAVEIYDTTTPARLLRPSSYWDATGDYIWEGHQIRFPQGQTNPLSLSPVARYVSPPGTLSASTAPTLMPPHARLLLVYRAAAQWASQGGMRDPKPYYDLEQRYWLGNPAIGDIGLLGALKLQNPFIGGMALQLGTGGILDGVSTGAGYVPYRIN